MKKLLTILFSAFLMMTATAKADINAGKAEKFIKDVTHQGIEELITSAKLRKRLALLSYSMKIWIWIISVNLFWDVTGKRPRINSAANLSTFIANSTFKHGRNVLMSLRVNISNFWVRKKQTRKITKIKEEISHHHQVYVVTQVPMPEGAPASVKWRVKETGGKMQIVDIIIENVNLAITSQKEYTSYIQKSPNGIDGLIKELKAKLK